MTRHSAAAEARQYRAGTHPDQTELQDYAEPAVEITVVEAIGYVLGFVVALACLGFALRACLQADALREAHAAPTWVPVCATEAECAALVRELEAAAPLWPEEAI